MKVDQKLTFKTVDGRAFTGIVRNPEATLGSVAGRLAATKAGLAGTFEIVNQAGITMDPNIKLADLPDTADELTLASELTPA